MRKCRFTILLALLASVWLPALLPAEQWERSVKRGAITAILQLRSTVITLADELHLTVTVEGPAGLQVQPPPEITSSSGWEQVEPAEPPVVAILPDGRLRWRQSFRLIPLQPAKELSLQVAPFAVRDSAQSDTWSEVAWGEPVAIRVTTEVDSTDLRDARDIVPVEEVPPPFPWHLWVIGVGTAVAGVVLAATLVWLLRKLLRQKPLPLSPDQWALRELDRIEGARLAESGAVEKFHTEVSLVLRRYLELRFALHAPRQTTAEFLQAMQQSPMLGPEHQETLRTFLQRCDLAKFARAEFSVDQCQATAAMARHFIAQSAQAVPVITTSPDEAKPGKAEASFRVK